MVLYLNYYQGHQTNLRLSHLPGSFHTSPKSTWSKICRKDNVSNVASQQLIAQRKLNLTTSFWIIVTRCWDVSIFPMVPDDGDGPGVLPFRIKDDDDGTRLLGAANEAIEVSPRGC
ncbi:hypothetical protein Q1695_000779 [Nippostrongylus brasiliensis]|nr:hypothetical protein Q1695_000779 [Nippostrongylus brasiliensis]